MNGGQTKQEPRNNAFSCYPCTEDRCRAGIDEGVSCGCGCHAPKHAVRATPPSSSEQAKREQTTAFLAELALVGRAQEEDERDEEIQRLRARIVELEAMVKAASIDRVRAALANLKCVTALRDQIDELARMNQRLVGSDEAGKHTEES